MKVIMILATGSFLTFPTMENIKPDCFSQGHQILKNIATYHGPQEKGEDQGWVLKNARIPIGVAGWYCK